MKRFGHAFLFRQNSFLQKSMFYLFGSDFIGAQIRLGHFKRAFSFFHKKRELTVLDAGCGSGDFSFYLAERYPYWNIYSYDIKEKILEENKKIQERMKLTNIIFSHANLLELGEKEKYDCIISIGTLIYFSKQKTMDILLRLTLALKKSGYIYLDLPQEDFLEVSHIPEKYFSTFYAALKKENAGELYTFDEVKKILEHLGFTIIFSNKSFSFPGKLAWELDNVLREKKLFRLRYFFIPLLILLARLDGITKHKKGCCFVILARKR